MSMTKKPACRTARKHLQHLLDENLAQTFKELSKSLALDESPISRRLHTMGKIQKEKNVYLAN